MLGNNFSITHFEFWIIMEISSLFITPNGKTKIHEVKSMSRKLRNGNMINRQNSAVVQPSNIGLAWPPVYDESNKRVKGFYPRLIDSQALMDQTISHENSMMVVAARMMREHPDATRVTLRCIIRNDLSPNFHPDLERELRRLRYDCAPGGSERVDRDFNDRIPTRWLYYELAKTRRMEKGSYGLEAKVNLGSVLPGFYLAYIGCNTPERTIPAEVQRAEESAIREITLGNMMTGIHKLVPITAEAAYERICQAGFRIERLTNPTADEIVLLTRLYLEAFQDYPFQINEQTIGDVVDNSTTLIARNRKGQIIASLVAEQAPLVLECGPTINLIELGKAATDRRYRGHGLLTALYHRMIELLHEAGYSSRDTLVYVEARAPWIPVNIATGKSSPNYCGMLHQHCRILSDRSPGMQYNGNLEDLNVWAYLSF